MFAQTIKDMRQMAEKHIGTYHKDTLSMLNKKYQNALYLPHGQKK